MSNSVYPVLPGLAWSVFKTPTFSTIKQRMVSGREVRVALWSYPLYSISLNYDFLRASSSLYELQTLMDFFLARQGDFDDFLFDDTTDDSVTAQQFGTGGGGTVGFQLTRQLVSGGYIEPVMNVQAITGIYDNGSPVTQGAGAGKYTIDSKGFVTFGTAPVAGHVLTWTGTYYYRCRFDCKDTLEFENFMYKLWALKKVDMIGCLGNKI